jgi:hypothetical protein
LGKDTVTHQSEEGEILRELSRAAGLLQPAHYRRDRSRIEFPMLRQPGPVNATPVDARVDVICRPGALKDGEDRNVMATLNPTVCKVDANSFGSSTTEAADDECDTH